MRLPQALVLLCTLLALLSGFIFWSEGAGAEARGGHLFWDGRIEGFVRRKVATSYVDRLSPEQQREAFYRAMDAYVEFDPYCEFIRPERLREWREEISGKYAGLGVRVQTVAEGLELAGVLPQGPAWHAGLRVGDVLVRADGVALAGLPIEQVTQRLKGSPGSTVHLGVLKAPRAPEGGIPETDVVVTRQEIRPPTLFTRRVGPDRAFGVIEVQDFAEETQARFAQAVDTLQQNGVRGIVIDLRDNGGGVLGVALSIVDRFLADGLIVRMEGRGEDQHKRHIAHAQDSDVLTLPLVVLVNGRSASASEVVAGALQDHRRALIVGTRTYGKFLVQQITELPRADAAVKLTTARYYTPAGRSYQRRGGRRDLDEQADAAGLFPDVIVPLDDEAETRRAHQLRDREARIWQMVEEHPDVPADWVDPQLERAIQVLSGELALRRIERGARRNG